MVIAIIAILAALLMPALERARRSAQRVVCMSNLHQIHTAAITYAGDHDGRLCEPAIYHDPRNSYKDIPRTWGNASSALNISWRHYAGFSEEWTGWWNLLEGSNMAYVSRAVTRCAAMPAHPCHYDQGGCWSAGGYMVDYSYRYNTEYSGYYLGHPNSTWYRPAATAMHRFGELPLFYEADNYRRDPATGYADFNKQNGNHMNNVWPHGDGGAVILHNGSAIWLPNRHFSAYTGYGAGLSWPSGSVLTFHRWGWWNPKPGLDLYVKEALR